MFSNMVYYKFSENLENDIAYLGIVDYYIRNRDRKQNKNEEIRNQ